MTILGDAGVGKTSIRKNFMGESMKDNYQMTIGADFSVYKMNEYTLHIWDIAGQIRFGRIIGSYFRGTLGSLLVFDITRESSYTNLPMWIEELVKNNNNKVVPLVLVGNKSDLREKSWDTISQIVAIDYAKQLSAWSNFDVPYIETSAITGLNVESIFHALVRKIDQSPHLLI